jgi:hypothetical protein
MQAALRSYNMFLSKRFCFVKHELSKINTGEFCKGETGRSVIQPGLHIFTKE